MQRKIELEEFRKEEEFGYSVTVYARDNKTLLKKRIFYAKEYKDRFLLREKEERARFLETRPETKEEIIGLETELKITRATLFKKAKDCLEDFTRSYAFID